MIVEDILSKCNQRYIHHNCEAQCSSCSYENFCPHNCEKCLDFIHNPKHAPEGAPDRKYNCLNMADCYTCKYSYRYTSEMIYAFQRLKDIRNIDNLKVLAFGCGPCTDLFALDYLKEQHILSHNELEYRGIDYSKDVWNRVHSDLKSCETPCKKIKFFYKDACEFIDTIVHGDWVPNLITFQYVFSDMKKHSSRQDVTSFIIKFSDFVNTFIPVNSYIILNDINLGNEYGGGRDYFYSLYRRLNNCTMRRGRFCDDNSRSPFYPRGYTYGEDSDGEFPQNTNYFTWNNDWDNKYSPFDTCASAQMIIKKEG